MCFLLNVVKKRSGKVSMVCVVRVVTMASKKEVALGRWRILKRALISSRANPSVAPLPEQRGLTRISVRSFSSFELFEIVDFQLEEEQQCCNDRDACWKVYSFSVACGSTIENLVSACVRHLSQEITLDALSGFNNTGNVCVWPSEEVMAYCCLKERLKFESKSVLELGGGMTCLAGLMLALTGLPTRVQLTDGNAASVENLKKIVEVNRKNVGKVEVSAQVLLWDQALLDCPKFDYILCADCLFFTDLHSSLAQVLHKVLAPGGQALLFNPHRSGTLLKFVELVRVRGDMEVKMEEKYNEDVWRRHEQLFVQNVDSYKPDIHYPVMVTITHK